MKKLLTLSLALLGLSIYAQPNTEVYLADILTVAGKTTVTNLRNISNNKGYDNQPSFYDENTVLFSSTRNGQTDIAKYDITSEKTSWVSDTPIGSEYSPLRIPDSKDISAIRLDTNGLQRLYRYDTNTGNSKLVLNDAKVGYQVWYSKDILVNTVLVDNGMDLVISNLRDKTNDTVQKGVGRSLHKIPNSELVGFIGLDENGPSIKSLNPITKEINVISPLPKGTTDICWLPNGRILIPSGGLIYIVNTETRKNPSVINLSDYKELGVVSRMAVSPNGKFLALVAEEPPSKIVQKQVDSYNDADLDAFVGCYAENVVAANFPSDTLYVGHEKMRENYRGLSPENETYNVEVVKRITIGNKVIDQEKVTGRGKTTMQIALYEVSNGSIQSMRFIFDEPGIAHPEVIVQQQMDAYNARDIEAFLDTYADSIEVYDFPNEAQYAGKEKMRESYAAFFDSTPDLNFIVKNRMVVRNIVIDEEYITANGNNFSAVAIYEVENGKISKVTFMR